MRVVTAAAASALFGRAVATVAAAARSPEALRNILSAIGQSALLDRTGSSLSRLVLETVVAATKEGWLDKLLEAASSQANASTARRWSQEHVRKVLEAPTSSESRRADLGLPDRLEDYRCAAAVLIEYDPWAIKPLGGNPGDADRGAALPYLLADSERQSSTSSASLPDQPNLKSTENRWRLRDEVRKGALKQLLERGQVPAALDANPSGSKDPAQRFFEAALLGRLPPIDQVPEADLPPLLTVLNLLQDVLPDLPPAAAVRGRLEWASLLEPFRLLAGRHFRGREAELTFLRDYVGVSTQRSYISRFTEGVRSFFGLYEKPPLLILGIGGLGKSTLLARFMLEHAADRDNADRISFVYLDLDRPGLCAEEPASLLVEAARQLAQQYPGIAADADRLTQTWVRRIGAGPSPIGASVSAVEGSGPVNLESMGMDMGAPSMAILNQRQCIDEFAALVEAADVTARPILFVLDTFEEVQLRSTDFVDALFEFLDALQRRLPRLRTVLAGRNDVPNFRTQHLALGNLAEADARSYLLSRGLAPDAAAGIAAALPKNPLLLRVAADWYLKLSPTERKTLNFSDVFGMDAEAAQAVVYRRFLSHVKDKEVQRLAHPGLILRLITPDLIRHVLAGPCGLGEISEHRASDLFDGLKMQLPLVGEESGALRLRSDLRRLVVRSFESQEPVKSRAIHEAAVAYYAARGAVTDRAEELYHRLKLDQDRKLLDDRWRDDVGALLQASTDELPQRAKSYLASRVGRYASGVDWANTDLADWERYARGRANELLRLNRPGEVVDLLSSRPFGPSSGLAIPLSRALVRTGHVDQGREVLKSAIDAVQKAYSDQLPRLRLLTAILYQWSVLEERAGNPSKALSLLLDSRGDAMQLKDDRLLLEVCTRVIRLARAAPHVIGPDNEQRFIDEVTHLLDRANHATRIERAAAAEVAAFRPDYAISALRRMGLAEPGDVGKQDVLWLLTRWDQLPSSETGHPPGTLATRAGVELEGKSINESWRRFVDAQTVSMLLKTADSFFQEVRPGRMLDLAVEFVRRTCSIDTALPAVQPPTRDAASSTAAASQ